MFSEFSDGLPGWRLPQLLFSTGLTSLADSVKRWKWHLLRYNRGDHISGWLPIKCAAEKPDECLGLPPV